jgi:hypothetical protein
VFGLKQAVGTDVIHAHEEHYLRRAVEAWQANPNLQILGNVDAERLSILSFVVRRPRGRYLHHNFVVAVLNDLFGIQSRGGCSCAGPYGHRLLGIDLERSHGSSRRSSTAARASSPGGSGSASTTSSPSRVPVRRAGRGPDRDVRVPAAARLPLHPSNGTVAAP